MKFKLSVTLILISIFAAASATNILQKFDRSAFYEAIKSNKVDDINSELSALNVLPGTDKDAFEGTLLMRKAGLVAIPAEKLKLFKAGRIKLETVLAKDSTNAEYRFLRLIIQEHAPKIVKYNKQLGTDKAYIQKSFKNMLPVVKQAIIDYSKSSKVLRPEDL